MSSLERRAVAAMIEKAEELGVGDQVPAEMRALAAGGNCHLNGGALAWVRLHPDDTVPRGCCMGEVEMGPQHCTCWVPVFNGVQAEPVLPAVPGVQAGLCSDCAYRKDSPERQDKYMEETLLDLPQDGDLFMCHDGMRRPVRWVHPDGREVEGSTADWQPPFVQGVPYRLDGTPGLICGGWAARAARIAEKEAAGVQ